MAATADTEMMRAKGISDSKFSRANDRRRLGFVEGQGGGTILLARGDLALKMGLPVLAWSPTRVVRRRCAHLDPGTGASARWAPAAAARTRSWPGRWPSSASAPTTSRVISKHDTSTLANDPNETELHERLADSMGRSAGAPLFVVSQKSLTGHAKGGAAAFQMMGMCQMLRDGVIPPNRSLDCVDDELAALGPLRVAARNPAAGRKVPAEGGSGHQPGLRSRVRSGRAGASAGVPGRAGFRAAARTTASAPTRGCWPASAGWRRRSPVGGRCTRSRPTAASAMTRRRSGRRPRCCSTRRRGSAKTTVLT